MPLLGQVQHIKLKVMTQNNYLGFRTGYEACIRLRDLAGNGGRLTTFFVYRGSTPRINQLLRSIGREPRIRSFSVLGDAFALVCNDCAR